MFFHNGYIFEIKRYPDFRIRRPLQEGMNASMTAKIVEIHSLQFLSKQGVILGALCGIYQHVGLFSVFLYLLANVRQHFPSVVDF